MFVCVADAGSFAAAAERLNLSPSAVSKGVARLEERLQVRLFARTTRRLALTDGGTSYYRTCRAVLTELEKAERHLHEQSTELEGRVRIDIPAWYGRKHAFPVLLDILRDHPRIEPHVTFTDRAIDLVRENVDVVVRIGGPELWPEELGHTYLGRERMLFCASPSYLQINGTPQVPDDLDEHCCVLFGYNNGEAYPLHVASANSDGRERVVPSRSIVVGDAESQLSAIVSGCGIGQLSTWALNDYLASGELVEILPSYASDGLPLNIAWQESRRQLRRVAEVIKRLEAMLTPHGCRRLG
jgi:DNA-binding transcriptional LysR family regulator